MARTGIPRGRGCVEWRGMVATQFWKINGRIAGIGWFRLERLPATRSASGSFYEECGVDNPRKISLLRDGNASALWGNSAHRDDCRWTSDQARRKSVAPGKWRRDRHFRASVNSRSL